MAQTSSRKRQRDADDTGDKPSHWAEKTSPVSDNCLDVGDSDEHEEDKIKLIADGGKGRVLVSVYCIL